MTSKPCSLVQRFSHLVPKFQRILESVSLTRKNETGYGWSSVMEPDSDTNTHRKARGMNICLEKAAALGPFDREGGKDKEAVKGTEMLL